MTANDSSPPNDTPATDLGLDLPTAASRDKGYQVLARKYRPQCFEDLIGQNPMVRTLTNAFATGRVAHAFMLTGVRGVGKTTTARLLARALNYEREGVDGPSISLNPPGVHCAAIAASRHVDVMEMDAASHTGINDIREILDGVRYAPVSARYKVYIIDEVHMLSTSAFNALLKTLEEPPPHAKFIFATTEIRKVPVTVLSRCQRFDLARIGRDQLIAHLQNICEKEGAEVAPDGLALISRAAEGSVRDALSILDQALVQEEGKRQVSGEDIRTMLGLADRTRVLDLFAMAAKGDAAACCTELQSQFEAGADPLIVLRDLLDHCHQCTRASIMGEDTPLEEYGDSAAIVRQLGADLSLGQLARLWQMLLKALDEARLAPDPLSATEMALIRICAAAALPGPEEAARLLRDGPQSKPDPPSPASAPVSSPSKNTPRSGPKANSGNAAPAMQTMPEPAPLPEGEPVAQLHSLEEVVALLGAKREMHLGAMVRRCVRLVSFRQGSIVFEPESDAPADLAPQLTRFLRDQTGQNWLISLDGKAKGAPTLAEQKKMRDAKLRLEVEQSVEMKNIMDVFPGTKIVSIKMPIEGSGDKS
ncbi:MAG: DNA polymerase III subunit gamma/tau [Robiginitomaculum sp.]|nr:MAG: DNA polymerase III subunit gamma/tau [Robiginitomaculum sp.]